MKILYVEDDPDDCEFFVEALAGIKSVECITAPNRIEAIQKLNEMASLPALIIVDIHLPLMDGTELIAEIKRRDQFKDIPIVVYSTTISPSEIVTLNNSGVFNFIIKPTAIETIRRYFTQILTAL